MVILSMWLWWDDENSQKVLSKKLCIFSSVVRETMVNPGLVRSNYTEIRLCTKSLHISNQQGDHPSKVLRQAQSKHWHNPIESMEYLQSIFTAFHIYFSWKQASLQILEYQDFCNSCVSPAALVLSKSVYNTASWLTSAKERCQRHISCYWKKKFVSPHLNCQPQAV